MYGSLERIQVLPNHSGEPQTRTWVPTRVIFAVFTLVVVATTVIPSGPSSADPVLAEHSSEPCAATLMQLDSNGPNLVHVTVGGDDACGTGDIRSPFGTPHAARNAIRDARRAMTGSSRAPVTVMLSSGYHFLPINSPLEIEPEDGDTTWKGVGSDTVLSGGYEINSTCWKRVSSEAAPYLYECSLPGDIAEMVSPQVLRIGSKTSLPARAPDLDPDEPFTSGWLFVDSVRVIGSFHSVFGVKVDETLPAFLSPGNIRSWAGATMNVVPKDAWHSYQAAVEPASFQNETSGLIFLNMTCPLEDHCSAAAEDKVEAGAKFYIYDSFEALSEGEWLFDGQNGKVYLYSSEEDVHDRVIIPTMDTVVWVKGSNLTRGAPYSQHDYVQNIQFENVAFADNNYRRYGFQTGFSERPEYAGFPDDGALRVSGGDGVVVKNCTFKELGGAGIVASNGTRNLVIEDNVLLYLGQSGIMLIGNETSEPRRVTIRDNRIQHVGKIHVSAGGVILSAASHVTISHNLITNTARWGIHIRDRGNGGGSSMNNLVEYNRLHDLGEMSSALGGISLIAQYEAVNRVNSTIRYNCVKNVIGFGNPLLRPYYSYGIFLDNLASGYTIHHNVIRDNQFGGLKIHYGHDNLIFNNMFVNTSDVVGSEGVGQVDCVGSAGYNTSANVFTRNIIVFYNETTLKLLQGEFYSPYLAKIDHNLYYNPDKALALWNNSELFPGGSWDEWRSEGYDVHSRIEDPLFQDAVKNDLCLQENSPAFDLGFTALPPEICNC